MGSARRLFLRRRAAEIARGGFGFLIAEDGGEDVFLPEDCLLDAINGDRVSAQTEARSGGRREGRVIKVLRRAHEAFPGVLERRGNAYAVKPDDNRIADRVLISRQAKGPAIPGDRVWVEVTRWKDPEGGIRGRVAELRAERRIHYRHCRPMPGIPVRVWLPCAGAGGSTVRSPGTADSSG